MSPEQIPAQPNAEKEPSPAELNKTIYVKRSNGEVSTMRIAENTKADQDGRIKAYIVEQDEESGREFIAGYKPISEKVLSDEVQTTLGAEYGATQSLEQAEKAPLTEAQEDIAELALEDAGVELGNEVDSNAHNYSPDELRAMREAAQRIVDAQPPLTSESITHMMNVETPENLEAVDPAADMLKDFDEDDRMLLKSYALAIQDRQDIITAAQRGEAVTPGASQEAAHNAAWAMNQLSPRAKEVAGQFARIYKG